jgi:hypothetical protein
METIMQYMTIIHELLQQQPQTHEQLRKERRLLATVEQYAKELKTRHEAWKKMLVPLRPTSHPAQIASEALEFALKEVEHHLPSDSQEEEARQFLDAAMFFHRAKPRA